MQEMSRLGRVAGIRMGVSWTVLVIFAPIAAARTGDLPADRPAPEVGRGRLGRPRDAGPAVSALDVTPARAGSAVGTRAACRILAQRHLVVAPGGKHRFDDTPALLGGVAADGQGWVIR